MEWEQLIDYLLSWSGEWDKRVQMTSVFSKKKLKVQSNSFFHLNYMGEKKISMEKEIVEKVYDMCLCKMITYHIYHLWVDKKNNVFLYGYIYILYSST